jgi:acyl-CoA synthetase (NDP forming)
MASPGTRSESPEDLPSKPFPLLPQVLASAAAEGRDLLLEPEVYSLLSASGIDVPRHRFVASPEEVGEDLLPGLGSSQVIVKVVSPDILHKSDVGGIAACAAEVGEIRRTVASVLQTVASRSPEARLRGALVVERIHHTGGAGREVLAGFRHDRAFGPVIFFGVGGLDAEYLQRVLKPERARAVRSTLGLIENSAGSLIRGTLVHDVLCGNLRGAQHQPVPERLLVRLIMRLSALADASAGFFPEGGLGLSELEVNPFVVAEDGRIVALDGLARLHRPLPPAPPRPVDRLRSLLLPSSALVIGVSAESLNVGRVILRNLLEGGGIPSDRIFVVHPRKASIDGCLAFPSLAALPEPVDLAVVSVPAGGGADRVVVDLVENRRAKSVTLISGGFGETEGGKAAEAKMREAVERSHLSPDGGVLVNGGNCLGIISVPGGYSTFFLPPYKLPFHDAPGQNVASISQSGAYLVTQISNLDRAVRPRYAISFGNQVDVTVSDYLEYLEKDPEVRVFAVYLEGFRRGDGRRFLEVAGRLVSQGRKVLFYKAGRTREGREAASSHTAAIVGDHEVTRELARSVGILDCLTLDMFEDYLMTFSFLAERKTLGKRVAVLSNAGFECTAAADKLYGLELTELSAATRGRLKELLPAGVVDVHNPVDTTPVTPTELYAGCVEALRDDPEVDGLVVASVPATPYLENLARGEGHGEDIARESSLPSRLIRIFRESSKPMVFSVDSGPLYEECVQMMKRAGLPCFRKVDRATRALAAFLGALQ